MAVIPAICRLRPPIQPIAERIFLDRGLAVCIVAPVSGSTRYTFAFRKESELPSASQTEGPELDFPFETDAPDGK